MAQPYTRHAKEMSGKKFGLWTVLRRGPLFSRGKRKPALWICQCICGLERVVEGSALRLGKTNGCRSCTRHIRPYEAIYNTLRGNARNRGLECSLSYEEYVELTSIAECFYCGSPLRWIRHSMGKNGQAFNLDRKDNSRGYHRDNVIPCCTNCNKAKSSKLTHEEMIAVGKIRRQNKGY